MRKSHFIILLSFFLLVTLTWLLVKGCGDHPAPSVYPPLSPEVIQKQVQKDETTYKQREDSLQAQNARLNADLKNVRKSLKQSGKRNIVLQTELSDLGRQYQWAAIQKDTIRQLENCDSLFPKMSEMAESYQLLDSLYKSAILVMEEQLSVKDSLIQVHQDKYNSLKLNFEKSILGQQLTIAENKQLQKQIKKQKRKAFIKTAAAVIVAGVTLAIMSR